jgi:hypothetical protein
MIPEYICEIIVSVENINNFVVPFMHTLKSMSPHNNATAKLSTALVS